MPWNENVVANCIMVPVTLSESRPKNRKGGVGIPRTAFIYSFVQLVYLEAIQHSLLDNHTAVENVLLSCISNLPFIYCSISLAFMVEACNIQWNCTLISVPRPSSLSMYVGLLSVAQQ